MGLPVAAANFTALVDFVLSTPWPNALGSSRVYSNLHDLLHCLDRVHLFIVFTLERRQREELVVSTSTLRLIRLLLVFARLSPRILTESTTLICTNFTKSVALVCIVLADPIAPVCMSFPTPPCRLARMLPNPPRWFSLHPSRWSASICAQFLDLQPGPPVLPSTSRRSRHSLVISSSSNSSTFPTIHAPPSSSSFSDSDRSLLSRLSTSSSSTLSTSHQHSDDLISLIALFS